MTGIDQVARLLLEIPYLESHPGVTLQEAADAFAVTPAQIRKDVGVAIMCGLPGGYPADLIDVDLDVLDDEGTVYLFNPTQLRALRLTTMEAAGLQLALLAVRAVAEPGMQADIDAVMAKIALTGVPEADLCLATGDPAVRAGINDAIRQAERVQLTYDGTTRGTTHPVVDPFAIYIAESVGYLSAYCVDAGWRTYRLDRIAAVTPTGESAVAHGRPDLDAWATTLAEGETVRLTVRQAAAWIAEAYPTRAVKRTRQGIQIDLPVADPGWVVRLLLSLGESVRSVEPAWYAERARAQAEAALAAYEAAVSIEKPTQRPRRV